MKTVDHYEIGLKMMEGMYGRTTVIQREAFLFGCIEPDINPLTYLKGSIQYQKFHGHNFLNASKVIQKYMTIVQQKEKWSIKTYYIFGKLVHYIIDTFTFPHNEEYTGNIIEHILYEKEMHIIFQERLKNYMPMKKVIMNHKENICMEYQQIHEEYMNQRQTMEDDLRYIFSIADCLYDAVCGEEQWEGGSLYTKLVKHYN